MDAPSIYPVASLHLPGSSPTRQSAGIQGRVAGIVSRLADPDAAGAVHVRRGGDRRLLQCLASLDGRRRIPSGLGRVQPERRPPQPRQWIGVGSGDTGPGLLLGLPVGGDPVLPRRRRHRLGGSQQLPPAALPPGPKADRPRRTHDAPMPVCRTARPPWPIAPGSGCALSAVPECWQWSFGLLRAPYAFPNLMIFSLILPTDVNRLLIRHRNCPPRAWGCARRQG